MKNNNDSRLLEKFNSVLTERIKSVWYWLFLMGVFFMILGGFAIIKSLATTIVSLYIFGFILLFGGIGYIIYSFHFLKQNWDKYFQYLVLGMAYVIASIVVIDDPMNLAEPLTMFLSLFFIFVGIYRSIWAFRFELPKAFLELFGGLLAIIFGLLILLQWPSSSLWVIGMFVGIDIFLIGFYFTTLALFAKNMSLVKKESNQDI